ncbi:hypothetical protein LXL04_027280 [Taraxacum kok-saghyz]
MMTVFLPPFHLLAASSDTLWATFDISGDALHASLGLPPAISVTMAKVGKLEIMCKLKLLYLSNVQLEQIVVIIDKPVSTYKEFRKRCLIQKSLFINYQNAEKNGDEMVDLLILIAFEALFDKYSIEGDTNSVVELGSSTNDKFSRHLIIRGYQGLLSKTTHILVHLLMRYVRGYTMEEEGIKDLKVCLFQKIQIQAVLMSLATFLLTLLFIQETVVFVSIYHHKQGKVQCFFPLDGLNYNSHVLSILKSSTSQVQTALKGSGGSKTGVSEGIEASIIYVRFKAAASEVKGIEVCQLHQQFDHFFPSTSEDISSLAPLVDPLCTFLYDTLRPKLIHETNLDGLCELVDILKIEVIGEHLSRRSESLAGIRPTLDRILADIHERLTFRARTHIRDEVCFNYSKLLPLDEDLDYPGKLEQSPETNSDPTSVISLYHLLILYFKSFK